MVRILEKPAALSFSGNLTKFLVESDQPFAFSLKKKSAASSIFEHTYYPGTDKRSRIDVSNIIEDYLYFTLQANENVHLQPNIKGVFVATIDSQTVEFEVIRGGISNLADITTNWLKHNFLTWQPIEKNVTYHSPEWISWYSVSACALMLDATFEDQSRKSLKITDCQPGNVYTANLQYGYIAGLLGKLPSYYDVYLLYTDSQKSQVQRYLASDPKNEDEIYVGWENSLGGYDVARMSGYSTYENEGKHELGSNGDLLEEYNTELSKKHVCNTGLMTLNERFWFVDFFISKRRHVYIDNAMREIVLSEDKGSIDTAETIDGLSFTFREKEDSKYLNVPRLRELPSDITIPVPSLPDFNLPPRLVEYARITLDEGVLFPAQHPSSQTCGVTTWGVMSTIINKWITDAIAGIKFPDIPDIPETLPPGPHTHQINEVVQLKTELEKRLLKDTFDALFRYDQTLDCLFVTKPLAVQGGVTMYADADTLDLPSIYDGLPLGDGLIWKDGKIVVTVGGGLDEAALGSYLTTHKYATQTWVTSQLSSLHTHSNKSVLDTITSGKVDNWNTAFGWGNHASVGYATQSALSNHVSDAIQHITTAERNTWNAKENALGRPSVNGYLLSSTTAGVRSWVKPYELTKDDVVRVLKDADGCIRLDASILLSGGMTMLSDLGFDVPSIFDNAPIATPSSKGMLDPSIIGTGLSWVEGKLTTGGGIDETALGNYLTIHKYATQTWVTSQLSSLHTHSNKSVLDAITSGKVSSWDAAYSHINDTTKHITVDERVNWNTAFGWGNHTAAGYAAQSALSSHINDEIKHITTAERNTWNAKENALGRPATNGYLLSSTAAGIRSWVKPYQLTKDEILRVLKDADGCIRLDASILLSGGLSILSDLGFDVPSIFDNAPIATPTSKGILDNSILGTGLSWVGGKLTATATAGTFDHAALSNRNAADQHSISAISGLQSMLDGKSPIHSHPYRPDTWIPTAAQVGAAPAVHDHYGILASDVRAVKPNTAGIHNIRAIKPFFTRLDTFGVSGAGAYADCVIFDTYSDSSGGMINAVLYPKNAGNPRMFIARGAWNGDSWTDTAEVWTNKNFDPNTKLDKAETAANSNGLGGLAPSEWSRSSNGASNLDIALSVGSNIFHFATGYRPNGTTLPSGNYMAGFRVRHYTSESEKLENQAAFVAGNETLFIRRSDSTGKFYPWRKVWYEGNSGTTEFDWSAKSISMDGAISGCSHIVSNQTNGFFLGDASKAIGNNATGGIFYSYGNTPLRLYTSGASRMFIRHDGFVGFGTDSPTEKVHINGNLRIDKATRDTTIYNTTANGGSLFNMFDSTRGAAAGFLVGMNESGNGAIWHRGAFSLLFATNGLERMKIKHNGAVSIAGEEDGGRFTVHGRGVFTYEENSAGLHCGLRIKNTGWIGGMNTGIEFWNGRNKTTPTSRIDDVMVSDGSSGGCLRFFTQLKSITNPNPNGLAERMRITDDGTIGIGITSGISATLHTVGISGRWTGILKNPSTTGGTSYGVLIDAGASAGDSALRIRNASTIELFHVRGDGNIGVGVVNPAYKLTIGDSDSGFHWHSDGLLSAYANGVQLFNWNSQRVYFNKVIESASSARFAGEVVAGSTGNGAVFFRPATDGSSWGSGNGALTVDIRNNNAQTTLLLARREGASTRMFAIEQLNGGVLTRIYTGANNNNIVLSSNGRVSINRLSEAQATLHVGGNILADGGITMLSDMRLKNRISNVKSVLPSISNIDVFRYTLKADTAKRLYIGVSAQQIQSIWSEFVHGNEMLSLDYAQMAAYVAIKGLQETKLWMDSKDKKIAELEKRIVELEKNVA